MSEVPTGQDARPWVLDDTQDFIVTIRLVGYGKQDQVKREFKLALRRVLELEFGEQVKSCKIVPISSIRLD